MQNGRVIVIGASAGGVTALLRIAPGLGANFPAPILLVLHTGTRRNLLPELLSHRGPNPAILATHGAIPQPGSIYVAPPDRHLLLEDGALRLYRGPKEHHARPAINPLFRSAALDRGSGAVGVILTGMLDDGAAGLYAIKACGGIAVVQEPSDAAEPSMPRSALDMTSVDHVVVLDQMASLLNSLALPGEPVKPVTPPEWLRAEHAISLGASTIEDLKRIGHPSAFTCPDCGGALFELKEGRPVRFLCHTGHAFSLRSLAWTQEKATDVALWGGLRALQEKEAILRRLARTSAAEGADGQSDALAEAERLAQFIAQMHTMITGAPPSTDNPEELEQSTETVA